MNMGCGNWVLPWLWSMIVLIESGKMDTKVKLPGPTRIWRSKKTKAQPEREGASGERGQAGRCWNTQQPHRRVCYLTPAPRQRVKESDKKASSLPCSRVMRPHKWIKMPWTGDVTIAATSLEERDLWSQTRGAFPELPGWTIRCWGLRYTVQKSSSGSGCLREI